MYVLPKKIFWQYKFAYKIFKGGSNKKMAKRGRGYLGLGTLVSVLLAIFFFGWFFAIIERFLRGNILGGILCIFLWWPVFFIIDIVTLILHKDITILA